jgi:excisionase family DNA binding protein
MTSSSNCSSSYFLHPGFTGPKFLIFVVTAVLYEFNKKREREKVNEEYMYTKQTLAAYLGVSLSTIHRLISQGRIETVKVGRCVRITEQALARFIKSNGSAL